MKKLPLILLFVLFALSVNAQLFFGMETPITKSLLARPEYFDASDLDSDGDLDALVVCGGTENLAWVENLDGAGNFGVPVVLAEGLPQPSNALGVDLDGDGDNDVVQAVWETNDLFWLENLDGKGNFSEPKMIDDYISGIWRVRPGDVDGDGDQDLVVAAREAGKILWYENLDGMGNFSDQKIIKDDMSNARDAFPADLDGDGDLDIVTGDWFTEILGWHENIDGKGSFSTRKQISDQIEDVDILYCFDFDGDSKVDILARNRTHVIWFKNMDGGNTFSAPKQVSDGKTIQDFFPTDFDGDNDIDVLVSYTYDGHLGWYANNGSGTFGPLQSIPNDIGGSTIIHAADLDGDGDQDYIGMDWGKSWVFWHENTDGHGDTQEAKFISKSDIGGPIDMVLADVNGDGDKEILLAAHNEDKMYLFERMSSDGGYGDIQEISGPIEAPSSIFPADLDGDGKIDILSASYGRGEIYWSKNYGNNQFSFPMIVGEFPSTASDVFGADMDGDGDIDVLGTSLYGDQLSVFKNDGTGNFIQNVIVSTELEGASDVIAADLDGDNDLDIAVAVRYDHKISWFENLGNLNFSGENVLDTDMIGTRKVESGDIDGDGDLDIIASGYNKIKWYENLDGRTDFAEGREIQGDDDYFQDVTDLKVFDIDQDGDLDVFAVSEDRGSVFWYTNEENGTAFIGQIEFAKGLNEPAAMGFEDVDGDGQADAIVCSINDNKVGWYKAEPYPVFLQNPQPYTLCQSGSAAFIIMTDKADSYQWQIAWPYYDWFEDLPEDGVFSGTKTAQLYINISDPALNQSRFRCKVLYQGSEFYSEPALLTVDRLIEADAGQDRETCNDFLYLSASWPQSASGMWNIVDGFVEFEDPSFDYCLITNIQTGTNILKWTITSGSCVSEDEVTIVRFDSVQVIDQTEPQDLTEGETAQLSVMVTGEVLYYQWYKDGAQVYDSETISGAQTSQLQIQSVTLNDAGTYSCKVTGNCNFDYCDPIGLTVLTTGVGDSEVASVQLYPNPVKEVLFIRSGKPVYEALIQDITGQLTRKWQNATGIDKISFEGLPGGMYVISLWDGLNLTRARVVKE